MNVLYFDLRGRVRTLSFRDPAVGSYDVRVRTTTSVISTGTETHGIRHNRRPLWQKARSEHDAVRRALSMFRAGTLFKTLRGEDASAAPFTDRTRKIWPLGYSAVGVVEQSGDAAGVTPGSRVACMGHPHADVMVLPRSLIAPVPEDVDDETAAMGAIASIALRGVHRAGCGLGDVVVVVGLGLIGLLTVQILHAYGVVVIGVDPLDARRALAIKWGAAATFAPDDPRGPTDTLRLSEGRGADAALVTAGSSSAGPVSLASRLIGARGRVVIVGATGLELPRGDLYRTEADVLLSRSYGPGRYDSAFEENARPYPDDDVRWDEQRNLREYLRLVGSRRMSPRELITSRFPFTDAASAYDALIASPAATIAAALQHDTSEPFVPIEPPAIRTTRAPIPVAVVGHGEFARRFHLPSLHGSPDFALRWLIGRNAGRARALGRDLGVSRTSAELDDALGDPDVEAVFVLTRHDSHASITLQALEAGKAVFVEKPMALSMPDAQRIEAASTGSNLPLAVGFNRRSSELSRRARDLATSRTTPVQMMFRVASTFLPSHHWVYDPSVGGGRVVGEACHFIDYFRWVVGAEIERVTSVGGSLTHAAGGPIDNFCAIYELSDGTIATLMYTDLGRVDFPKERFELYSGTIALAIDDFMALHAAGEPGASLRLARPDKGFEREASDFARYLRTDDPCDLATAHDGSEATRWALETERAIRASMTGGKSDE